MKQVKIIKYAHKLGFEVYLNKNPKLEGITGTVLLAPDMLDMIGTDKVLLILENTYAEERLNIAIGIAYYQLCFDPDKDTEYCKCFDTRVMSFDKTSNILSRACEILLPKGVFTQRFRQYKHQSRYEMTTSLMKEFEVPSNCIKYRLHDLNLERN